MFARASLKGSGDESQEIVTAPTGNKEIVRTYGWYLRRFLADAKAKGAIPVVLSPVPRNRWNQEGAVHRAANDYSKWAKEAAQSQGAAFVDLNEIVAKRYEQLGPEKINALFGGDHTHTNLAGAELNAASVIAGLKTLADFPLRRCFSPQTSAALLP